MTLTEIIAHLETLDSDATIFAERVDGVFVAESKAVAFVLSDSELSLPLDAVAGAHCPGLDYYLEVETAHKVLDVWSAWRGGRSPSPTEAVRAVTYYASNDAYLPC